MFWMRLYLGDLAHILLHLVSVSCLCAWMRAEMLNGRVPCRRYSGRSSRLLLFVLLVAASLASLSAISLPWITRALEIKDLGRPCNGFKGLQDITGADYHNLLVYHYGCGVAAQKVGDDLSWLPPSSREMHLQMWTCKCRLAGSVKTLQIGNFGDLKIVPWFAEYLVSSGKELLGRPCESTIMESKHYNQAMIEAAKCDDCKRKVIDDMDRFRARFKAHSASVGGISDFFYTTQISL